MPAKTMVLTLDEAKDEFGIFTQRRGASEGLASGHVQMRS